MNFKRSLFFTVLVLSTLCALNGVAEREPPPPPPPPNPPAETLTEKEPASLPDHRFDSKPTQEIEKYFQGKSGDWSRGTVTTERGNTYMITDRKLEELHILYGDLLDVKGLRGKKVLDIGSGGGAFVQGLREYALTFCLQGGKVEEASKEQAALGVKHVREAEKLHKTADWMRYQGSKAFEMVLGTLGKPTADAAADAVQQQARALHSKGKNLCDVALNGPGKPFIEAEGVDSALPAEVRKLAHLKEADFTKPKDTKYAANSFDALFSSWAILTYEGRNPEIVGKTLQEAYRILKVGGSFTATPIYEKDLPNLEKALKDLPGFEMKKQSNSLGGKRPDGSEGGTGYRIQFLKRS